MLYMQHFKFQPICLYNH